MENGERESKNTDREQQSKNTKNPNNTTTEQSANEIQLRTLGFI
jgi:hypothetical protein